MDDNSSNVSEISTDDEYEALELLHDPQVYSEQVDKISESLLKSTFQEYLKDPESVYRSGLLIPDSFNKLWSNGSENWLGYLNEPDLLTGYCFSRVETFGVDNIPFNPTHKIEENFLAYYHEFLRHIKKFDHFGGVTRKQLYAVLEKILGNCRDLISEYASNPFEKLANKYYSFIQRLMDYKNQSGILKSKKEKYEKMLKNPKTKLLVSLYTLLTKVSDKMLPTVLVCGSKFFNEYGNLKEEIVQSKELLELTYNAFAKIKKHIENNFDTATFNNKPLLSLSDSGFRSSEIRKQSSLGFSYIPNVPMRNFLSFSSSSASYKISGYPQNEIVTFQTIEELNFRSKYNLCMVCGNHSDTKYQKKGPLCQPHPFVHLYTNNVFSTVIGVCVRL